jgi:hypothetical protein
MAVFQRKENRTMELLSTVIGELGGSKRLENKDFDTRRMYGGASRRTHQPIRRQSRLAGRCEAVFWKSTKRQDVRQIVLAAKRYDVSHKEAGKRNGALGHVALEIIDYLANLVDYRTGRLEPSIDYLMRKLRRSRDAIVRGLKALRTHGFIDWLRRYVPTGNEGAGVQVQQTSNAYRLMMPKRAKELLGRYGRKVPCPDDFAHAQVQQAAQIEEWRDFLSFEEKARFDIEDDKLAESLARLGALMDKKRESAERTESQSKFSFNREKDEKDTPNGVT